MGASDVPESRDAVLRDCLALLAPGTLVRDGIDRIIAAGRGALIVLAYDEAVQATISGGFLINTNATSQRVAELAKMDGAMILDLGSDRILQANVHLVPDSSIATSETGTRHRTAERVARQTGHPVLSVSESMSRVTLYVGDTKKVLEPVSSLLFRANQALSTLERYRSRLEEVTARLSLRELHDEVSLRDVCVTLQRSEMVRRIEVEVGELVAELGREGRLIELQRAELMSEVEEDRVLLVQDYRGDRRRKMRSVLEGLDALDSHQLLELDAIAAALDHEPPRSMDKRLQPRGYRLLARIPRLPTSVVAKLISRFTSLPRILSATVEELQGVEGIGEARARGIRDGLHRLVETSTREH
ncbi:MAG: diadenylate cyclase [Nitriliruptoraceae bacterium]